MHHKTVILTIDETLCRYRYFRMILLTITLFILSVDTGYAIFGYNGYSEYRPGDLQSQLIIVSPHGGAIRFGAFVTELRHFVQVIITLIIFLTI